MSVDCSVRPLHRWDGAGFTLDASTVAIRAGSLAGDPAALEDLLVHGDGP